MTSQDEQIEDLLEDQASHLFGYMQNPEIVAEWDLNHRIFGIRCTGLGTKVHSSRTQRARRRAHHSLSC